MFLLSDYAVTHEQEECHLRSWLEYDSRSTKPGIVLSNVSRVAKGLPASGKVVSGQWHYRAEHMMLLRLLLIRVTVMVVRFIAILLVAVLLPLSINVPSVMACSTTECCGANCSPGAPVSQVNCCKAPVAPDRAISQAQDAHAFRFDRDDAGSRGDNRNFALAEYCRRSWVFATRPSRFVCLALFPSNLNLP